MNELKFAFRQLLKNPGFTAVAVLTLALGIAANTAIFSFVNAILLQPLPYKDADRLVMIYENYPANGWFKNAVAAPMLDVWRKQSTVFEGLGARGYSGLNPVLTSLGPPETITGWRVSANVFGNGSEYVGDAVRGGHSSSRSNSDDDISSPSTP